MRGKPASGQGRAMRAGGMRGATREGISIKMDGIGADIIMHLRGGKGDLAGQSGASHYHAARSNQHDARPAGPDGIDSEKRA